MSQLLLPDMKEVAKQALYLPSVSIFLPYEPKMISKSILNKTIKNALEKVERKVFDSFNYDIAVLVMQKLSGIINNLDSSTHKKTIAIFVSPFFEKILYLNTELEEKIIVGESFHIRDLIKNKKEFHNYLLLKLSAREVNMYYNVSGKMKKIFSTNQDILFSSTGKCWIKEAREKNPEIYEQRIEKFFHCIDNTLGYILEPYSIPLLVTGNNKLISEFKKVTRHHLSITDYIACNDENNVDSIEKFLTPYLQDWKKIIEKKFLNKLLLAASNHKLVTGIKDVYKTAKHHGGKILLVEEGYNYPEKYLDSNEIIFKATSSTGKFSYLKDAVDEIIEKVLEEDGEVEFVEEGILKKYDKIALIL